MSDRLSVEDLMMLGGWGEEAGKEIRELQRYATQLEAENERLMGIVDGQDKDDNLPSLRAEIIKLREWKKSCEDVYRSVMNEPCSEVEKHCTCVPWMRKGIDELKDDNARLLKQLEQVLESLYPIVPAAVARLCDEKLDRSGALLGRVRDAALKEPDDG